MLTYLEINLFIIIQLESENSVHGKQEEEEIMTDITGTVPLLKEWKCIKM
jgi:hypothetical protein